MKLEPRNQKNKYPFFDKLKTKDKYKGMKLKKENDFSQVISFENLYSSYKKSKSGSKTNFSKLKFEVAALDGIYQLRQLLLSKNFTVSEYHKFMVHEPKEREILAGSFRDKVVQHCLCDYALLPLLKSEFIETNYAGQIGKGTLFGLDKLKEHMLSAYEKYGHDCWIIKADIRKYYYTIDHEKLKDIVEYFVHDKDTAWLCNLFIDSTQGAGIPLGNQVTQVFGLLYLSGLDHFITDELGIKFYGRYVDDFYLITSSKNLATTYLEYIKQFVETLGLDMNGKTQITPFKNGLKFCGFHSYITKDGKYIRKILNSKKRQIKRKYKKMARKVKDGNMNKEKFMESYNSCKNHLSQGNCIKFTYELDKMVYKILEEGIVFT